MNLKSHVWIPSLLAVVSFVFAGRADAVPTAPTSAICSAMTNSTSTTRGFRVSWTDNSSDENFFELSVRVNGGTAKILQYPIANLTQATTYLLTSATPTGTNLVFTISACKGTVSTTGVVTVTERSAIASSPTFQITTGSTPEANFAAPTSFAVTVPSGTDGKLLFAWTDNSNQEDGFEVDIMDTSVLPNTYYGPTTPLPATSTAASYKGVELVFVTAGAQTFELNSTLVPGRTYKFRIRAFRGPRTGRTAYTPYANEVTLAAPSLATPTLLTQSVLSETNVKFDWKDNSQNEMGYVIQGSRTDVDPDTAFENYTTVAPNSRKATLPAAMTSTLTGLIPGATYTWKVLAYYLPADGSTALFSSASNTVSSTLAFNAPTSFTAVATHDSDTGDTRVAVAWLDNSSAETGYEILYRESSAVDPVAFTSAGTFAANATSGTLTSLPKGMSLNLIVRAIYSTSAGSSASATAAASTVIETKNGITSRAYEPITQGSPFSFTITTAQLSPATRTGLTCTGLPAGLSLNSSTGVISGTPTESGVFVCPITATFTPAWVDTETLTLRVRIPNGRPTTPTPTSARTIGTGSDVYVPLTELFADPDTESAVRVVTTLGNFDILLQPTLTPQTVRNFMAYVDAKDYDGSMFHRAAFEGATPFVLQGGGFRPVQAPDVFAEVTPRPSPINEPGIGNLAGTVALAKQGGNPNSGTHDFFVSIGDNTANLDNQNGGFTVFGRVPTGGMTVVNAIQNKPRGAYAVKLQTKTTQPNSGSFDSCPMNAATAPTSMDSTKVIKITSITPVDTLAFTSSSTNATAVTSSISNGMLKLHGVSSGSGTADIIVVASDLDNTTTSHTITVTVTDGFAQPVITQHPRDKTVAIGTAADFSVTASGSSLSYQWLKDGAAISGATSATYSTTPAALTDSGEISVRVSNAATSVTSLIAQLHVTEAPTFTLQPVSQTVNYGTSVTFEAAATGSGPLNYQWYFMPLATVAVPAPSSVAIFGAVSRKFTLAYALPEYVGSYTVKVSNGSGLNGATTTVSSSIATLSVTLTNDSDNDGLTDIQEDALRTSRSNTDTDGDGFSDRLEYDLGTNPALKTSTPAKVNFIARGHDTATLADLSFRPIGGGSFTPSSGGGSTAIPTQWVATTELTQKQFASLLQYGLEHHPADFTISASSGDYLISYLTQPLCYLASPTSTGVNKTTDIKLYDTDGDPISSGSLASFYVPVAKANLPVSYVSWYAGFYAGHMLNLIHGYATKTTPGTSDPGTWISNSAVDGYTLPAASDWEWAARSGAEARAYGTGATISTLLANYNNPTTGKTKAVGSYRPSSLGLYDISGNVAEWVYDPDLSNNANSYTRGGNWADLHINNPNVSPLSTIKISATTLKTTTTLPTGIRLLLRHGSPSSSPSIIPTITTQPQPRLLIAGETLSLSVVATGPPTLKYQWLKNNVAIVGQTSATLTLPATTLTHAGTYKVRVTAHGQSATSNNTNVAIATIPLIRPYIYAAAGSITSLTVPTAGSGLTYQWEYNNGIPINNDFYIGDVQSKPLRIGPLSASRDSGVYVCAITSAGASRTVRSGFILVVQEAPVVGINTGTAAAPVFTITMPTNAIVGGTFSFAVPYIDNIASRTPSSFTITGLPLGLTYNAKTGLISGKPRQFGTFQISIKASNAAGSFNTVTTTLIVERLPVALVGSYVTPLPRDILVGTSIGITNDLGGRLDITVQANGTYTGKARLGAAIHNVAGALNTATGSNPTSSFVITRKGNTSIGFAFTLNPATSELEGIIAELNPNTLDQVSDSLSVIGWKNTWSTGALATAYQGLHAIALDIPEDGQVLLWIPQGTGYGTINVTNLGLATAVGKTGDGSAFASSAPLRKDGTALLFSPLYTGRGSLFGTLPIGSDSAHRIISSGSVDWRKKSLGAVTKDRLYPAGFFVPLTITGGLYNKPTTLAPLVMGLTAGNDNVQLSFVGEDFGIGFTQLCTISAISSIKNTATFTTGSNPQFVSLSLTPATGAFSGTLKLTNGGATRLLKYAGQLIPHPGLPGKSIGYGTYLIPSIPVAPATTINSPITARQVILEARP